MVDERNVDEVVKHMGGWNHRVVRQSIGNNEWMYQIHEVYYDDDRRPIMSTTDPVGPFGETLEELVRDLNLFMSALKHPVLYRDKKGILHEETSARGMNESTLLG